VWVLEFAAKGNQQAQHQVSQAAHLL
jgi:hypothetical protein